MKLTEKIPFTSRSDEEAAGDETDADTEVETVEAPAAQATAAGAQSGAVAAESPADADDTATQDTPRDGEESDDSDDGGPVEAASESTASGSLFSFLPWVGTDEDDVTTVGVTAGVDGDGGGLDLDPDVEDLLADHRTQSSVSYQALDTGPDTDLPPVVEDGEYDLEAYLDQVEQLHQRQVAAPTIEQTDSSCRVGDIHRRVMLAHEFPDNMQLAGLKQALDDPDLHLDMTIHFRAADQDETIRNAESLYSSLDASASVSAEDGDEMAAGDKARRQQKVQEFRRQMKDNDEQPISTSMYVSARGEDKESLRNNVDEIRETFRSDAGIKLKTLERKQKKALVSASPVGVDPLRDDRHTKVTKQILGKGFGALGASFTRSRKFDPEGHEWGIHATQGHPIVKDPFKTTRNYNLVCVGESGTGKSLNMKQLALATKAVHPETMIVMLDPLSGFKGLAEALDAKTITVGGSQSLNPMEIRKPPEEHINSEAFGKNKNPLSARVDDVMSFIVNYVHSQPGLELGDETQLLRSLILGAYKRKGITEDISTHGRESPTIREVLDLAGVAKDNPEQFAQGPQSTDDIEAYAEQIGYLLREFYEGGQYEHLGTGSTEDLFGDSDVIYLDLSQQESSGGSGFGVLGQLMFSLAYERCKEYHGPALYIVDEARYMFREAQTLEFLAQRVRHSRHFNTSIRFITQEMDDFFEFEQAEGIVNNASFKVIHQSADVDDWGDTFDLNERHKAFIKNCATGSEKPYSQALVQFPEEDRWYPLTISLGETMLQIADFDERRDRYEDLPGNGTIEDSPLVRELRARLRRRETHHHEVVGEMLQDWEEPIWELLSAEDIRSCLSRIEDGEDPRHVFYQEALTRVRWLMSETANDETAEELVDRVRGSLESRFTEGDDHSRDSALTE